MAPKPVLSAAEHERIAAAIRDAEARTTGEIYCVVARASDSYFFPAAFAVALSILALSLAVALWLDHLWISLPATELVASQLVAFGGVLLLLRLYPPLAARLVPRRYEYRRAHDNAMRQFLAHNVHMTSARTGVLLFVSLEERYATVLADAGINAKTTQDTWDAVVAGLIAHAGDGRLVEGFEAAVAMVGAVLAEHFPAAAGDANELPDHLIEI